MMRNPEPAQPSLAAAGEQFACPTCATRYRWSAQLEGKKIRCKKCGQTFWPRGDPQEALNALAQAGAKSGYAMLAKDPNRRMASEEEELTAFHNWVLPLVVLGLGLSWRMWQSADHAWRHDSVALWQSLLLVMGEWIVVSIACAGGVLAAAMFVDIDLDKIGASALKVVSTVILMCSLAQGGLPSDIAEAVTFMASPYAAGVNGRTLRVCGQHLVGA